MGGTHIGYDNEAALVLHVLELAGRARLHADQAPRLVYPVHVVQAAGQLGIQRRHVGPELAVVQRQAQLRLPGDAVDVVRGRVAW